jgi:hypothetical protein
MKQTLTFKQNNMKHSFSLRKALSMVTIITLFSCANDDDTNQTNVISLEDLTAVIDENPANGQVIGNVETTQTIGGATLAYNIDSQTPTGALAINSSTGELTVANNTLFDFETNQTITATVSLAGGTNTANITINLNNLPDLLVNYTETVRPDASAGEDAFLSSAAPDNNYGTHPDFISNKFSGGIVRSLIRFDFSIIPTTAIVNSVKLSLYAYNSPANGSHFVGRGESYLQTVDSNWDESTVTWNNQPSSSSVNQVTLDNAQTTIQDYLNIDITTTASTMIVNPSENHGYIIRLVDETLSSNKLVFGSSDNQNIDLHPKVVVEYSIYE